MASVAAIMRGVCALFQIFALRQAAVIPDAGTDAFSADEYGADAFGVQVCGADASVAPVSGADGEALCFIRCGRITIVKSIVPTSIAAAKIPKSLSAGELSGISAQKAPTVVMLPVIRGETTWRSDSPTLPLQWYVWVIRCSG